MVWEESIALAPPGCRMAFLSATLPNAAEFAGWVAATHGSPCHVVYTDYRPTPLQHFIFPQGGRVAGSRRGPGAALWDWRWAVRAWSGLTSACACHRRGAQLRLDLASLLTFRLTPAPAPRRR